MSSIISPLKRPRDASYSALSSLPPPETVGPAPVGAQSQHFTSDGTLKLDGHHHRIKRPRTERYQRELQRFKNVQKMFDFFQQGLRELNEEDQRKMHPTKNPQPDHDRLILKQNLERQSLVHETEFQGRCQSWMNDAQERLNLKDSIGSITNSVYGINDGINAEYQRHPSSNLCILNQGKETTDGIIGSIVEYSGGVPSDREVVDCNGLLSIFSQRR